MTDDRHRYNSDPSGRDASFRWGPSRASGGGTWVQGVVGGYRFEALVFPEHADNPAWEIEGSRISKLWVQRRSDRATVYNWDRGQDVPPEDDEVGGLVTALCSILAEQVYGK